MGLGESQSQGIICLNVCCAIGWGDRGKVESSRSGHSDCQASIHVLHKKIVGVGLNLQRRGGFC